MNRFLIIVVTAYVLAGVVPAAHAQDGQAEPAYQRFARQMSGVETCLTCHGSFNLVESELEEGTRSLWVDSGMFLESVHARLGCTACHTSIDEHGHRLTAKESGGKGCLPCHEEGEPPGETGLDESPALDVISHNRKVVTEALKACINCHPGEYLSYKDSVHGVDVLQNMDSNPPYCTDCHGSHYILHKEDERAWTNPVNIPATCLKCHADATIQQRYQLTKDVGETFEDSFHRLRGEVGSNVAICITCHGSHEIYAASDGRSMVNSLNVSDTCGQCHEGAQLNFASAFTHTKVSRTELTGLYAVVQMHKWMIVSVIAPLLFLVFSDLFRSLKERKAKAGAKQ